MTVTVQGTAFGLRLHTAGGACVITVAGDLDIATSPHLRDALAEVLRTGPAHVVVDLAEVTFVDSMGLAALLNGLRRLTRINARLSVVATHPNVLRTFRLSRLDTTFVLFESVEDALADADTA